MKTPWASKTIIAGALAACIGLVDALLGLLSESGEINGRSVAFAILGAVMIFLRFLTAQPVVKPKVPTPPVTPILGLLAAMLVGGALACPGGLTPTQRTYAHIGWDSLGCAARCGLQVGDSAIDGIIVGDDAYACLERCAFEGGFAIIKQLAKDIIGPLIPYFGTADDLGRKPVYRVRLVRAFAP